MNMCDICDLFDLICLIAEACKDPKLTYFLGFGILGTLALMSTVAFPFFYINEIMG